MVFSCGVDEAGRGAVVGPMVVAAYMLNLRHGKRLRELGVVDSKSITRARREKIYEELMELGGKYVTAIVTPRMIDAALRQKGGVGLNTLEAEIITRLINTLKPGRVYIDSPDRNTARFKRLIAEGLESSSGLICENKADSKYVMVSAASIIAKVTRDRLVERLHKRYGDFGSGYPSDPKTRRYISGCLRSGRLPPIVRKGWKTVSLLRQTTLEEFEG